MPSASDGKRLILLDAHAILHRAYHALPDFSTASGVPTGALYGLSAMLIKIIEDLKPDYMIACYDLAGPTYRHEAYKEYKAGRKKAEDDLVAQMKSSRSIFESLGIPIYDKAGFEADDMLGTIVEQITEGEGLGVKGKGKQMPDPSPITHHPSPLAIIIASGDMDTLQLVNDKKVQVYTLKKGIKDTIMYDEEAVRTRFGFGPELIPDYKGLRGDPSDNIVGVKGIGEKTATILITAFGTIEDMYRELAAGHEKKFEKAGVTPRIIQLLKDNKEEAEFSKMLATIRRDAPIKFELPEKTFKESLDLAKVRKLWTELEFRSLIQRLEKAVLGKQDAQILLGKSSEPEEGENQARLHQKPTPVPGNRAPQPASPNGSLFKENINKEELEKTALALWIVKSDITDPTLDDILNFANTDDFVAAQKTIFAELDKRELRKVYDAIELPLIPVLKRMQDRGIKVDRKFLAELSKKYHAELSRLEKEIWKQAGMEFNINSPKQLGEVLFDKLQLKAKNMKKTEGGARSTKESELEKLRDLHPIVPHIFDYRELSKLLGTYIDAIPPLLDQNDRLHTRFIQSGSTTGRMASENPNLQNIPVKSELGKAIRHAFIADRSFSLVSFDYSQMELRIAAFMSGDEKLIDIFRKKEDVHSSVASFVFKIPMNEVTPEMRRRAKVINFGIIYGMGVVALRQNLGTSREEAQEFLNEYFATFSTLASYLDRIKAEAARKGYTETFFGRRRYFEGLNSRIPYIRAQAERMAVNAPIQGTEADVIKLAMIRIAEYIKSEGLEEDVYPLLQVHDELIYEMKSDTAKEHSAKLREIMESVVDPKQTHGVVLEAHASIADDWGKLK